MNPHCGLIHHLVIRVSDARKSAAFYKPVFRYFGYELAGSSFEENDGYQDWKRWHDDTPHEINICQSDQKFADQKHIRRAVGHHDHLAFSSDSREDVDRFYAEVLLPLERRNLTTDEDPPCDCPEYGEGYHATFFHDPYGLKYEFVINPNHLRKKDQRESEHSTGCPDLASDK